MDVTESTVDVELCEETEGEVSSTCNDNVRLDDSTVNSDMISSDCQSFVVSNDSSENTAVLQEETSHSLSPDTSGVVLRYVSEGDGVVCMPFETQGDMNTVEIQEDVVEEEVSLTSDLETVPEVSIPVANVDEREIISLEENVLISTTMDEGDFAVLNWEGEEIVEMSSADNLDLQEQMEQSVDVSSATQDTSSLDARGGAQLAAQSLPFASNPDSTTIETSEANNNIVIYENEVSTTGDELCMVSTSLVIPVSTTTSVASNESLSVPGSSTSVTAVNSSGNIPICMLRQRREESHLSSEISTQNSGISTTSSKDESAHKRRWDQVPVSASCNLSSNTESLLTSWSRSRREDTTVSSETVSPTCSGKNQPEKVPKLDRVSSSKDSNLHCHTLSQTSVSDHQESNIDTTSQAQFCSVSHPSQKVERDLGSTSDSTTTDASVSGVASSDMVSCKEDYGNGATSSTSNDDSLERRILSVDDSNNQVSKSSEAVALEQNRCKISGMNNNLKSPHSSGSQDPGEIPEATHSGLRDNSEVSPSPLKDLHEDADKVKDNVVSHSKEDDRAKHTEASSGLLCTGTVPAEPCCRIDDRTSTSSGDPPTSSGGEKSSNTTVKHPERKSTDRGNDKSRFSILSGCRKPLVGSSVASETLKSSRLLAGKGSSEESRKESKTLEGRAESLAVEAVAGTSNPSSSGLHKMTGSTETKNGSSFPSQEKKPSVSLMASRNVASSSSSVSVTLSSPEERDSSKGNGNLGTLKANIKVSDSSLLKAQEYSKEAVELRQTGPKAEGVSATCSEDRQQDAPSLSDKLEIGHSESVIANAGGETTSSSTGDNMESPKEEQSLSKELGKIFSDSNESGPVAKSGELASLSTFEDPTEFDNQTTIVKSSDQLEEVDSIATKTSVKSGNDSEEMKSDHSETQKINPDKIKTYSRFTSEGGKSARIKERPETVKTSRWDVATFAPKIKHDALHSDVAKISEHERKPSHFGDDDWKLGKEDKLASVKGISKASVSCIESTPKIGVVSSYCKSRDRPSGKETVTPVSKGNTVGHDPIVTAPCSSSKSEDLKSNILKSVSVESKLTRNVKSDPSLITKVDSISSSTAPLKTRVKLVRPPLSSVRESSSVTSSKLTILESFQEKLSVKKPEAPIVAKATSKGDVISTTEETDKELDDLDSEPHSFPKEMRTYSRLDVMQSKGSHSKKLKSLNTKEFLLERDDGKKEETQRRSITSIPKQATARPSIRQSYVKDCTDLSSKESSSPTKFETRESKMEKDDGIKSDDNVLFSETMETTETFEETTPVQTVTLKSVDEPNTDIETPGEVHLREEIKSTSDIRKSICDETEVSSTPSDLKSKEQHTVHDQPVLLETRQDRKTPAEDPSSGSKTKVNQDADMTSTDKCQSVGEELQRLSDTINSDDQISTIISSKSAVGPEIISLSSPGEKTTEHTVEAKETNGTKGGYGLPMNEHRSLDVEMSIDKGLEIIHKSEPTNPPDVKNLGCNLTHKTEKQTGIDVISEEKLSVDKPERLPEDRSNIVEVKQSSEIPVECPEEDVFHGHIKTDSLEIVKETTRLIEEVKDVAIVENSDNEKKSEKITEKSECAQKYEEHEILQMLTEEKSEECVKEPCSKENFGSFKSSNEEGIVDEGSVSLGVSSGVEDTTIFSQSEKEGEEVGKIMDTAGGRYPAESQERSSQSTADTSANEDLTKLQNKSDSSEQELKGTAINTNVNSELRLEVMEDTSQSEKHNVDNETSQPRAENSTDIKAGTLEAAPCVVVSVSESLDFNQLSKENTIQTPSASVENLGVVHKKEDDSIVSQSFDSQSDTIEVSKTSVQDKKEDITSNIVKQEEKKPEVMVPSEENSAIIKPDSTVELKISTCAEKTDEWEIFEGSDNEKSQKEDTDGNSSASGDELEEIAAFLRQSEEESRIGNSHKVKELGETVPVIITSSGDDREGSAVKESTVTEGKLEETEITVTTEHAREQEAKDSSATDRSEQNTTASSSQDIDKDVVIGDSLMSKERSKEVNQEDTVTESGSFSSEKVVSLIYFQEVSDGKTNDSITEIDKSASEDQSQSGESRISSSNVEEVEPAVGKTEKIILKITKDKKSPKEFSVQEVEEGRKTESENSGGNNTAATVQDFELASSSDPTSLKVTIKASEQSAEGDRKTPITLKLVKDVSSEGKLSGPGYMSVPSPLEKEEGNVKKSLVASSENTKVDKFTSRKEARKLETSVSSSTSAVMVSSESTSQPSQVSSSGMSDESEVGKLTLKLKLPSSNETGSVAVVPKASTGVKPGSSKQPENNSVHEEEQPKVEKLTLKLKKDGHCENVTYTKSETKAEVSPKVEKLTIKTKTVGSSECIVAEPIHENALDTSRTAETMFADTISLEQSPKVEKLTLRLRKDSAGSDSSKSYVESSEIRHSSAEDSPKREKITLRIRTDSGSSEISNPSKRSRKDSCSLEVCESVKRPRRDSSNSEFSVVHDKTTSGSLKVTDTHTEECTSSEKITLTLRKVPSTLEVLSTQEKVAASGDSVRISEDDQLSSSVSKEENKVAKLTLKLKADPSKGDKKDVKEASVLEDAITSTSNVDKSEETPRVEKLTLKLKKDQVGSAKDEDMTDSSASSDVPKVEKEQKVEKLTLKLKKDQVSSSKDENITDSLATSDVSKFEEEQKVEKLTLKLKKDQVSSAKDEDKTDSSALSDVSKFEKDHKEDQKVEKLTLKLKKDQVSSAKDEDITDFSASSDVSKFEEEQKVEKLTLKLKKDQVSSAKDEDKTDSSASSGASKFEKDHKEEQKVEKLTLKVKKDQVSSAKDEDKTDSSASSGASKFEKDHKEEQKVEKLTLKVKKDQVSSAKDEDKTDSSASSDVSKFEKDHKEEQKVEKLTLKLKKDQVSSAKNEDKTDSSASSDVSKFEKDHKEEQKVEKLTLKLKKDQVSSVKDEDKTDSLTSSDVSKFEKDHKEEQKVEKLTLKLKKDQVSSAKDENITDSSASSNVSKFEEEQKVEKLTLKLKKDQVSSAKDEDKTDSSASSDVSKFEMDHKEEQKVEKLTLKLKKDQVSSAKEEDITDFSASSDVSKFEEEQKVEKLALKLKKDQVSSAKDEDKTDSSASSDASKFEKDHKEEQKVEKLTLKVKKDQVSSAEDEDKTDYSASDVSKFEKDHKEEQKVEKLTIKLKKDQVSSAKDEDKTDSSASSDVSKFEKDHKEEQKVEKLTLKLKKDQVSNATDMDIVDSSASSDVSKFEKEHQEEQKVETFTLKVKKDQVSSAKDEDITDSSASSDISKFEEERKVEVEKLTLKLRKDQVSSGKDVNMTDSSVLSDVPKFEEEQKVEKFTLKLRKDNVSGSDDSSEVVKSKLEVASKEEQKVEKLTLKLKKDTVRCDCPTDDKSSGKDEKPMKEEKLTLKLKKDICKSDISDKEENKVEKLTIKRRKESAPVAETKQPLQYTVSPTEKKKPVTTGTGEEEVKFDKVTLKIKKDESKSEMTTPSLTDVKPHSEIKGKNSTSKSETVLPSSGIADKSSSKGETTALSASPSDQTCINVESKKCDSKSETVLSSSSTGEGKLSKVEVDKNSSKATPSSNTSEEICTDIEAIKNTSKSEEVLSSSGAGKRILSEVQIYKKSSEATPSSNTSEEICGDEEAKKNVLKSEAVLSSSGAGEGMLFEAEFKKNSSKAAPSSNTTVVDTKKNASELEDAPQSLIVSDETLSNVLVAEENAEIETVSPSSSTTSKTQTNVKSNEVAPLLKRPLSSSLGDEKHTDKNISKTDGLPTLSSDKTDESHSEREIPPDETDESHSGRKMLSDKTDESHTGKEIKEADPKPEKVHSPPALNADSKQTDSKIEKDDLKDGTISQSSLHDKLHPGVCIKRADSEAEVIPSSTSSIRDETPTNQNIQNEVIEPGTVLPSSLSTKEKVHSDARIDEVVSPSEVSVTETEVKDNQKISSEVVSSEPTDTTSEVAKHSATYVRKVQDLPVGKREVDKDKPVSEEQSKSDEDNDGNSIVERSPSEQYELSGREENIPELKTEEGKSSSSEPLLDDKEEGIRRLETKGEKQLKLEAKAHVKKEITPKLKAKEDKPLCSEARLDEKEEEKAKLESGGEKILRLETKVDAKEGKMTTLKTKEEKFPDKGTELEDKEECKAKFETKGVELSRLDAKVEVKEEKMATLKTTEKKLSNTRLRLDDKEKGMKKMATKGEEHSEVGAKMDAKKKIKATVKAKGVAKLEMKGEKQFKLEVKTDAKDKITAVAKSKQEKVPNTGDKLDDKEEGMAKLETKEKQSKLEPKMDTKEKITATVKSEQEKLPSMAAKLDNKEEEMAKLQKGEKPSKLEQKMDAKEKITATVKSEQEKLQITAAKLDDKEKEMGKLEEGGKLEPKMDAKEKITGTVKSEQEKLPITAAKLDDKEKEMAKLEEGGKLEPKMDAKEKITATVKCKQEKLLNTAAKLGDKEEQMAKLQKGEKPSKMEPKLDADEEGKATLKIQEGKLSNTEAKSDENLGTKEEKATKLGTKAEKSPKLEAKIEKPALKRKIDSKTAKTFDAGADVDSENKITSKPSSSATENSPQKVIISVDSVSEKLIIGGSSEGFAVKKVFRAHEEATFEEKQLSKTEMKSTAKESSDLKDEEPKSKKLKVEAKVLESSVVPPPVDEVSQDVEVIYSVVEGQSDKQERIEPSPPRVEGKLREILSKMGGQASKLLDSDLSISISQPEATPPVFQAAPGYMKITLVQDDKEVINLDSDSDTVGSSAAVPIVGPSPEQFEPLGTMQGLSVDVVEPVKKKGRGRPRKSTLPAKPILPRPESESRPKRMCRGREGPIVQPKKPRGGGRGRGRGRASGMKRRADEDTPERMPGDRAFSEVSPGITASSPKVPRMSSLMDSTVSTSPPSSPPPSASLSSISVFGIPTPKCDNSLPSTTDSIVTTTTMITSPTAGVKPSSTFSSVLATAESTSTESAGVSTPVTTSASSAFFSLPTSVSPSTPSPKNAALTSSTSPIAQSNTITTQAVTSTDTSPVSTSKPAMSFLNSSPDSSGLFLSAPSRSEPELPTSGLPVSTVQVFEEETRMSADCGSRSQTPARTLPSAVGGDGPGEESQGSAISTATTESVKKKTGRMEVGDAEMKEFTVDQIAEYQWPPDKNGELLMVQEQISEYLGVKSFKRKYPDLRRRFIDSEERTYLREKGLVSEGMCDMGLTAIYSSEVLDVMFNDFQEKYEEYRRYQRDRQAKELTSKQKGIAAAASADKSKQDYKEKAISSAASWNAKFNKARKDGRRACFDLQSFTIHYPRTRTEKMAAKDLPKVGQYPIALIPGQFTDFYKSYTPTELRYFPLNTVLYGPMKPNERQEATGSDGSQSDSDESSSSDDSSSSSSSDGTQDTEETASTNGDGDQDVGPENGVADKEGPEKAKDKAGVKERDGAVCKVCSGDKGKNKEGRPEVLIHCATCTSSGHVSCFDLTLDMVPHIRRYDWQCTDCKTCIQCKDPADEDKMLFCDMCDRGYHIYCVGLRRVPNGRWHCKECAVCGSCGAQEPCGNADPSTTPNAQWQHEYKKGEKGTRVYAQTLCVPCSKLWRKGRYCQLCWRCYGNKPEEEVGLINCTVCDKWMHADCCNTVGGIEVNRSNYLCEICQEKGQARSPAVKLSMRPAVKV
ncbi:serine-rich adhesin for platelets [Anabrus simplex]|uniref:serine-rich adhesin for platelets n=1 Tax=Anabrus simplex TaxID=316456 RepID=UPI0035A33BF9